MKRILFITITLIGAGINVSAAQAGVDPVPLANDHRIRVIPYDRNNVTQLKCHYDIETTIEYSPGETIIRATAGQPAAWKVIPSQVRRNILTIQPALKKADTNLTVITNKRVYLYELKAREQWNIRGNNITFFVRYIYPNEVNQALENRVLGLLDEERTARRHRLKQEDAKKIDPAHLNIEYTYGGDPEIAPLTVFDDGQFTYFKFDQSTDLPAIYTVDAERNESVLNYRIEPPYVVVEQVANRFTLRSGHRVTTIKRGKAISQRLISEDIQEVRSTSVEW